MNNCIHFLIKKFLSIILLFWLGFDIGRRTNVLIQTLPAIRLHGSTNSLPESHKKMINLRPKAIWKPLLQSNSSLFRFLGGPWYPLQAIGQAMDVHIHSNSSDFVPGHGHANVGHLWTNSWQGFEFLGSVGYIRIVFFYEYLHSLLKVFGFVLKYKLSQR